MKKTPAIAFKRHFTSASRLLALIGLMSLLGCGLVVSRQPDSRAPDRQEFTGQMARRLSPAQDHAGEILAYFLQVVTGHIGSEKSRQAWQSTGGDAALDFQKISRIMSQPATSKAGLMVLDFDLLSLVEVLCHYNPRFNLFKGRYIFSSVYPSSELIAIRLLIQRKLNQGEKISFTELLGREALLQPQASGPSPADLQAVNLSAEEFQLVKEVFISDPLFFQYYKHPFIVDAMTRIGFYQKDRLTEEIGRNASYKRYAPGCGHQMGVRKSVTVVVLPSFTREFEFGGQYQNPYIYGFKPSAQYLRAVDTLKTEILDRTAYLLAAELKKSAPADAVSRHAWKNLWQTAYAPLIHFQLFDQRPLTIYPENADRLVKEICPTADVVILLLGEGIERVVDINRSADGLFSDGRLFFDMDDIRYFERNDKIDGIAREIVDRLLTIRISSGDSAASGPPAGSEPDAKKPNG